MHTFDALSIGRPYQNSHSRCPTWHRGSPNPRIRNYEESGQSFFERHFLTTHLFREVRFFVSFVVWFLWVTFVTKITHHSSLITLIKFYVIFSWITQKRLTAYSRRVARPLIEALDYAQRTNSASARYATPMWAFCHREHRDRRSRHQASPKRLPKTDE